MKVEDLNQGIYYRGIVTRPTVLFASALLPVAIPSYSLGFIIKRLQTVLHFPWGNDGKEKECVFFLSSFN